MYLHGQSRSARKKREDYYARGRRRQARRAAQERAGYRAWNGLNFFWADCGSMCRRAHRCPAADPRVCYEFHWNRLEEKEKLFRQDFMQAFVRLKNPHEALIEALALAIQRRDAEDAASSPAPGARA